MHEAYEELKLLILAKKIVVKYGWQFENDAKREAVSAVDRYLSRGRSVDEIHRNLLWLENLAFQTTT